MFLSSKKANFYLECQERTFVGLFDLKKQRRKKFPIFDQSHGPLKNCKFWKTYYRPIWSKTQSIKKQIFDQNQGLTSFQKSQFCHFSNLIFLLSWTANFLSTTSLKALTAGLI